jgi:hypothetical protein
VNPDNSQSTTSLFEDLKETWSDSLSTFIKSISEGTNSLLTFCQELKHYENTKFLIDEHSHHYYSEKSKYLLRTFSRDLTERIEEVPTQ